MRRVRKRPPSSDARLAMRQRVLQRHGIREFPGLRSLRFVWAETRLRSTRTSCSPCEACVLSRYESTNTCCEDLGHCQTCTYCTSRAKRPLPSVRGWWRIVLLSTLSTHRDVMQEIAHKSRRHSESSLCIRKMHTCKGFGPTSTVQGSCFSATDKHKRLERC